MATIDINVPVQFDAGEYIVEPFNREALSEVFKELEFRTLARQILGENDDPKPQQGGVAYAYPYVTLPLMPMLLLLTWPYAYAPFS